MLVTAHPLPASILVCLSVCKPAKWARPEISIDYLYFKVYSCTDSMPGEVGYLKKKDKKKKKKKCLVFLHGAETEVSSLSILSGILDS